MSIFEHSRFKIFNPGQHPLKHDISDFAYANQRLPGISLLGDAVDYIVAVLYPNYIGTYATTAALPVSASANDYALVSDDGDGKAAGYVWSIIDGAGLWIKRYDVDWSMEAILSETVNRTLPMYYQKYGNEDKDAAGVALTGALAGQHLYGGSASGSHLTLHANAGDVGGGRTGYIQLDDSVRPTVHNTLTLGTSAARWSVVYSTSTVAGTLTLAAASITDSSGAISFDNENLTTTGSVTAATIHATSVGQFGDVFIQTGSIEALGGAISFGANTLATTGTLASGTHTVSADMVIATGSITSASGAISFSNENLTTTGTLAAGNAAFTRMDADNVRIDGNTISTLNTDGVLQITPDGNGYLAVNSSMTVTGNVTTNSGNYSTTTGYVQAANLRLAGNTLSAQDVNGSITISPNGTGTVVVSKGLMPSADATLPLGATALRFTTLYLSSGIGNGTSTITVADLLALRSTPYRDSGRTQPAQAGDTIFWDGSQWLASVPDTEIAHGSISGLTTGDAGHTQFAMLAGRAGGQAIQGGTAASENLTLESTSNVTKGRILFKDVLAPNTNASYSGGWSGTDLGDATHYLRDVYSKGEFKGFRLENYTAATLPASSGQNIGRLVYTTDTKKVYVDTGAALILAGGGGGGGGSLMWVEDADAPLTEVASNLRCYCFQNAITQQLYALVRVPASYSAGGPIKVLLTWYSPDSSGTALIRAQATLLRPGTDAVSATTNQRTTTNAAVTMTGGTANVPQAVTLDISDTSGQINGVAVSPGDLIKVRLYRDTDTGASDIKVPVYGAEVTFS